MVVRETATQKEMDGRTVPVERRKEVRIAKDGCDGNQELRTVTYKVATEKDEIESAFSLVWDNYVAAGLQQDTHQGIRFTKYHLLPQTRIFIARFHEELAANQPQNFTGQGKVIGTISLVLDSPMGLPMEEFCADEMAQLRRDGGIPAEVVAFALNPEYSRYKVFLHLFKLAFQFAEMKEITDLCCSVTERHIKFYQKICLFEPMGDLMPYSAAYKLKVQGHRLNIAEANKRAEKFYSGREFDADLHRFFFTESYNRSRGEGKPLSEPLLRYFLSERTNFIDFLEDKDLEQLRTEYQKIGATFPF